jgi:hypothetical protein
MHKLCLRCCWPAVIAGVAIACIGRSGIFAAASMPASVAGRQRWREAQTHLKMTMEAYDHCTAALASRAQQLASWAAAVAADGVNTLELYRCVRACPHVSFAKMAEQGWHHLANRGMCAAGCHAFVMHIWCYLNNAVASLHM